MDDSARETVRLVAGTKTSGEPVYEEVLVEPLPAPGQVKVLATPGLVLDVAAGDVLHVDGSTHEFTTVSRGGNLAVQVFGPHELADLIRPDMVSLGGRLDGRAPNLTIFTVPAAAGFGIVEHVLNTLKERHPAIEWYYGNVYDKDDGVTPLNWWL